MAGEQNGTSGQDQFLTLREYNSLRAADLAQVELRFAALKEATAAALAAVQRETAAALAAQQRAVEKAEASVDKRLEGMNEIRATMADKDRLMMPRAESENRMLAAEKEVAALSSRLDRGEGRGSGLSAGWGYLVAAVGLLGGIIAIFYALSK